LELATFKMAVVHYNHCRPTIARLHTSWGCFSAGTFAFC